MTSLQQINKKFLTKGSADGQVVKYTAFKIKIKITISSHM